MKIIKWARIITLSFLLLTLLSCAARIDGSLKADGSATLNLNMSLERGIASLIQRMFAAGGQQGPALDGPAIARSMATAPGITSATLRNTSPTAIEGQIQISQINHFRSTTSGGEFITFNQRIGGGGRFIVNIDRENGAEILDMLSPEIADYLSVLMAPIATGEEMDKNEYLELVTSLYSKTISDEIASSRIRASIEFPGTISSVKGGTFSERRAAFVIPLIDLLVLEKPLVYEVYWN